jgi:hypothetical protein
MRTGRPFTGTAAHVTMRHVLNQMCIWSSLRQTDAAIGSTFSRSEPVVSCNFHHAVKICKKLIKIAHYLGTRQEPLKWISGYSIAAFRIVSWVI